MVVIGVVVVVYVVVVDPRNLPLKFSWYRVSNKGVLEGVCLHSALLSSWGVELYLVLAGDARAEDGFRQSFVLPFILLNDKKDLCYFLAIRNLYLEVTFSKTL